MSTLKWKGLRFLILPSVSAETNAMSCANISCINSPLSNKGVNPRDTRQFSVDQWWTLFSFLFSYCIGYVYLWKFQAFLSTRSEKVDFSAKLSKHSESRKKWQGLLCSNLKVLVFLSSHLPNSILLPLQRWSFTISEIPLFIKSSKLVVFLYNSL